MTHSDSYVEGQGLLRPEGLGWENVLLPCLKILADSLSSTSCPHLSGVAFQPRPQLGATGNICTSPNRLIPPPRTCSVSLTPSPYLTHLVNSWLYFKTHPNIISLQDCEQCEQFLPVPSPRYPEISRNTDAQTMGLVISLEIHIVCIPGVVGNALGTFLLPQQPGLMPASNELGTGMLTVKNCPSKGQQQPTERH